MIDRREFLGCLLLTACAPRVRSTTPPPSLAIPHPWLEEKTLGELGALMARGEKTSRQLCEAYLERIRAIDVQLKAVIEINPDALAIADAMDAERKAGRRRGALHGIPVLVKDNLDTADRMQTTAGSLALVGARPAKDAGVVAKLRDAGAVLLGKTNLSEWANIRSTRSVSGWSARGGQTRNPYALDRNPCGSSSGSGAAVAANLCAVAIGTETDGSILCPSALCGLVGIKPTVGLVSRAGVVPISHTQDTPGPMARTVADAAILLAAIADKPLAAAPEPKAMKIGVVRAWFGKHPEHDAHVERAIAALKSAGVEVIDPVEAPSLPHGADDPELELLMFELKADLDAYLATANASVKTLADVIAFNKAHAADEMPIFGQELFEIAVKKGPLTDPAYQAVLARYAELEKQVDALMTSHGLTALVGPTYSPAMLIDPVLGDQMPGGGSTTIAATLGYASMNVPVGFTRGLPVGITLSGGAYTEPALIALATVIERALHARRPPTLQAAADVNAPDTCGRNCSSR